MKTIWINRLFVTLTVVLSLATGYFLTEKEITQSQTKNIQKSPVLVRQSGQKIALPSAQDLTLTPLDRLFYKSLPIRTYQNTPMSLDQLSSLLFSAQGVITRWGDRTVPSYKSLYPLYLTVLIRNVESIEPGVYGYISSDHSLSLLGGMDENDVITIFDQASIQSAPIALALSASQESLVPGTLVKRATELEAGQVAQNVYLEAANLSLGTVMIPFESEAEVKVPFYVPGNEEVLWVMPVGIPGDMQ